MSLLRNLSSFAATSSAAASKLFSTDVVFVKVLIKLPGNRRAKEESGSVVGKKVNIRIVSATQFNYYLLTKDAQNPSHHVTESQYCRQYRDCYTSTQSQTLLLWLLFYCI